LASGRFRFIAIALGNARFWRILALANEPLNGRFAALGRSGADESFRFDAADENRPR
jgi:hypothetical protein